jgi:hypothetical protein
MTAAMGITLAPIAHASHFTKFGSLVERTMLLGAASYCQGTQSKGEGGA